VARGAAWLWLVIYAGDPALVAVAWVLQSRIRGVDPPGRPSVPRWYRTVLAVQAAVVLTVGISMFAVPGTAAHLWPWPLTPLTARAISSWLVGLGLVLVAAIRERDWTRLRPATFAYVVLGVLETVALLRYPHTVDWVRPAAWAFVVMLASVLATGLFGVAAARRSNGSIATG